MIIESNAAIYYFFYFLNLIEEPKVKHLRLLMPSSILFTFSAMCSICQHVPDHEMEMPSFYQNQIP